mmetsp:Transcript_27565/g.75015  ORF Transcript_27565/g.75015 Transcript_27565/m.75015 type:complete len:485 (+) Transcript_27565:795-2249(+)
MSSRTHLPSRTPARPPQHARGIILQTPAAVGNTDHATHRPRPQIAPQLKAQGVAVQADAAHRTLDPEAWGSVIEGVGGLDEPLEQIRRRVYVPMCAPTTLLEELGAERVKGLLLYGPPGCGKSLLASRLAAGLSRRPPTIVSGPEIMDKYVGSSEAQLRNLFTDPPRVKHRVGDAEDDMMFAEANELHVIVLDEFDSIARRRSDGRSGGDDSATRDSVVNQLLALMDGVADLPVPTFVLALTNHRELVDSAVLRPGRLEIHVEIGKPDAVGRAAILKIHAEKMRASGRLSLSSAAGGNAAEDDDDDTCDLEVVDDELYDEWIEELAEESEGFTGAALAAITRAAVSRALDRSVSDNDALACKVTDTDFASALVDVRRSSLELAAYEAAAMKAIALAKEEMRLMEAAEANSLVRTVSLPKDIRRPNMYLNRVQPYPSPALVDELRSEEGGGGEAAKVLARLGVQAIGETVVGEIRAQPVDGPRLP